MPENAAPEFEIVGCHCNRAGEASVTLRHVATGTTVAVHHVPFEHDYGETVGQECRRIRRAAAGIARQALAFLEAPGSEPVASSATPTIAPQDDEPPSPFGQVGEPS